MYKFRIYPTKPARHSLDNTVRLCRELYNAALTERREAYRMKGISLNYYDQQNQLPEIKEIRTDLASIHSQVLQDVLKRVDLAFKGFFTRIKRGVKAGFPRFQGRDRYDSFTFPQGGWSIKNDRLTLSKIGTIKVKLHREVLGKVKTCTIKREAGNIWFVVFSVETEIETPQYHPGGAIGIDVGLEHFANLSNGEQIENPRFYRKAQKKLAKIQRKWDKVKRLSRRNPLKRKASLALSRAHRKTKNCRLDFQHKLSKNLVSTYSLIVVEDLNIKGLAAGMLAKSVNDAGWSGFIAMLRYKVENTGSKLVEIDPRQTSQICPECGAIAKKELSVRWHSCPCGAEMHRDTAAAIVILSRGLATLGLSLDAPAFRRGE